MPDSLYDPTAAIELLMRCSIQHWDGHWIWLGLRIGKKRDYGAVTLEGRCIPAHRAAWMAFVGPIPDGMEIDHECYVTMCMCPAHLRCLTETANRSRAKAPPSINPRQLHFSFRPERPLRPQLNAEERRTRKRDWSRMYRAKNAERMRKRRLARRTQQLARSEEFRREALQQLVGV